MPSFTATFLCSFLLLISTVGNLSAQSGASRADAMFQQGAYPEAIRLYERYLKKNPNDFEAKLMLARAYKTTGDLEKAEYRYGEVVFDSQSRPEHKLELAKLLKTMGKYEKARTWFQQYAEQGGDANLGNYWASSCDWAIQARKDSLSYRIVRTPLPNGKLSDLSPAFYRDGVAFATSRKRGFLFRFFNGKSNLPFYDIYYAEKGPGGVLQKAEYIRGGLNTRFHDGPVVFTPSEHMAFVTRSHSGGEGGVRDAAGYNRVSIYTTEYQLERWKNVESMPFNSAEYNVAHPAINADATVLIFSSDMPGGFGGTDLYVSILENEGWSDPVNMGPAINSAANEGYPYLSSDSTLFFSSDRAMGFGGKDVFSARLTGGGWGDVRNVGYPLNTSYDDFAFAMRPDESTGYFTTNRPGGEGDDDIASFRRYKSVDATIVDARTGLPIKGAEVLVEDINMQKHRLSADANGRVRHTMRSGNEIRMTVRMNDYYEDVQQVNVRDVRADQDKYLTVRLKPIRRYIVDGTVRDAASRDLLENVTVRVIGENEDRVFSDDKGHFSQEIQKGQEYTVIYFKDGYIPRIVELSTENEPEPKTYTVQGELKTGSYFFQEGIVVDTEKKEGIPQANIHVFDANTQEEIMVFNTRKDGAFYRVLEDNRDYSLVATKNNYLSARVDIFQGKLLSDTAFSRLELVPLEMDRTIKTLFHAYNETSTDLSGRRDLQEVAYLLKDNPEIKVELSSHTDARGGANFNKRLSQNRAEAMKRSLIRMGIAADRIVARGYGEEQLYNNCKDGEECSEELHAQNRRTEVKIISIDEEKQKEKEENNKLDLGDETEGKLKIKGGESDGSGKLDVDDSGKRKDTDEGGDNQRNPYEYPAPLDVIEDVPGGDGWEDGRIPGIKMF